MMAILRRKTDPEPTPKTTVDDLKYDLAVAIWENNHTLRRLLEAAESVSHEDHTERTGAMRPAD